MNSSKPRKSRTPSEPALYLGAALLTIASTYVALAAVFYVDSELSAVFTDSSQWRIVYFAMAIVVILSWVAGVLTGLLSAVESILSRRKEHDARSAADA